MNVFAVTEKKVHAFQKKSGLSCAEGCGHCCLSADVETTVIEMYPIAEHLLQASRAEEYFDKAKQKDFKGPCVFYRPDPLVPDKGRCSIYPFRPTICRLYGFSALLDKRGAKQLYTCPVIKLKDAAKVKETQKRINMGLLIPVMKEISAQVYQVDPHKGDKYHPINKALKLAIEAVGLFYVPASKPPEHINKGK